MINPPLREALDRTLLLMRDELVAHVTDQELLDALTSTEVVIVGDAQHLACHSAQCAYVTAAMLMARSGHRVHLAAPGVRLILPQPPLLPGLLIDSLIELGRDLLPGVEFSLGAPDRVVDLAVAIGDSVVPCVAARTIALNASRWTAGVGQGGTHAPWSEADWPFGAMGAGALAAGEAFKVAMRKLRRFANDAPRFDKFFAFCDDLKVDLAPRDSSAPRDVALGRFDLVSGGAITNAVLFALARIPGVSGVARVIEPDIADRTNLNRYSLLRQSHFERAKAEILRDIGFDKLSIEGVSLRFEPSTAAAIGQFATCVLVGVDHIPTRWEVQRAAPHWLGIGATTHWSAMASFHQKGLACAGCLHPRDDSNHARIPTVAFVSFWAGLLLASYFVRHALGESLSPEEQYLYLTPLRLEAVWRSRVAIRSGCPAFPHESNARAA